MRFGQWNETIRRARKSYICSICEREIEPKQTYVHWKTAGIDEDEGFVHHEVRVHKECQDRIDKEMEIEIDSLGDLDDLQHMYP